jgi:cytochrome b6-f complex iron-sulfur subunit
MNANKTITHTNGADTDAGDFMSRRTFAKVMFGGVGLCYAGAIGYPVYRYLASPIERSMEATKVSEVSLPDAAKLELGAAMMFKFGAKPAMLIHHKDDTWSAMEAVCTHLACTVQYQAEENRIYCACHGGVYDIKTGAAVSGPPPKGLKAFNVKVQDGTITVSKV